MTWGQKPFTLTSALPSNTDTVEIWNRGALLTDMNEACSQILLVFSFYFFVVTVALLAVLEQLTLTKDFAFNARK